MSNTITYEHESTSGLRYLFTLEYEAHKAERATWGYAGGEPGYPAHAEWSVVKCEEISVTDNPSSLDSDNTAELTAIRVESSGALCAWFSKVIDKDEKLRREINELCLDDANERDGAAREGAAEARFEAMREREWQ